MCSFWLSGACLMWTQETVLYIACASCPKPGSWEGSHQPGPVDWVWDSGLSEGWTECRMLRDKMTDSRVWAGAQDVLTWLDLENGYGLEEGNMVWQRRREFVFTKVS